MHLDVPYVGALFGERAINDIAGVSGDSGSVVRLSSSREPFGVYMGSFNSAGPGTPKHGGAQTMTQAVDLLDLDVYQ